jgi:FdhE protein
MRQGQSFLGPGAQRSLGGTECGDTWAVSVDGSSQELASLRGRSGVTDELLALEDGLLAFRTARRAAIAPRPNPPSTEQLHALMTAGTPLVSQIDPLPDDPVLATARDQLLEIVGEQVPALGDLPPWFAGLPEIERASRTRDWFGAAWRSDPTELESICAATGIDADLLLWAGRHLARPFFQALAGLIREDPLLSEQWSGSAGCPSCGGPPRFGRYAHAEGERHIWCDLCDLEWYFPRITCAFCLNQNHKTLGYLKIEEEGDYQDHRIDVCEECHGYLRAVDERGRPEDARVDYLIEDVGSLELCLAAEHKGYRPGTVSGRADASSGIAQSPEVERASDATGGV